MNDVPTTAGQAADTGTTDGERTGTVDAARAALERVRDAIGAVVVGQGATITGVLCAMLVRGHVLLEGVPGVAKTLLVSSLARTLELASSRVQFTPDLMPSDIIGHSVLDRRGSDLRFREGPVFTNLLLADELNRTPPRTQAALLEAMQERHVTVDGRIMNLPDPFLVVATQNPIEHEGTYPLPDAQLDRFLMKLLVGYPDRAEEQRILDAHVVGTDTPADRVEEISAVASAQDLERAREAVGSVRVEPAVRDYVLEIARATREMPAVELGVSPRGAGMLLQASRAWAWLDGRPFVGPDEVKAVTPAVLRHRIRLRPELELEGTTADGVIDGVLATVPVPR